jgi:hypothetical protein
MLEIKNCYFGVQETGAPGGAATTGQYAVTAAGPVALRIFDCAFGPHLALFELRSGARQAKIDLGLRNCSAFLVDGSAFQISDDVYCRLDVQKSVFSRPISAVIAGAGAALIQQIGEPRDIHFEGYDNRYHNLSAFWLKSASPIAPASSYAASWEQFQKAIWPDGGDKDSRVLTVNPWADKKDPLRWLKKEPQEPGRAFQVDTRLAEMRQIDNRSTRLVGVEYCTWGIIYDGELPALEEAKSQMAAERIVDPAVRQSGNGVYPTVRQAIDDAKPGDVVLIRYSGLVKVDPIRLSKANINLTIKPYPDWHPVLTLAPTAESTASLFRLHHGTLKLEQLEFFLHPVHEQCTAQAVVDLVGSGQCFLKDCVVTLQDPRKAHLALASLSAPALAAIDSPWHPAMPSVQLERCFVRGEGDLTAIRGNHSLDLQVEDSVVALAGSFLNVDGIRREPAPAAPVQVKMTRVTTYLTEHLVHLTGPDPHALVPVWMRPVQDCLFASAGGKALVRLDGLDSGEAQRKGYFIWEGKQNIYSRFAPMVDQKTKTEDASTSSLGTERWKGFTGETDSQFTPVKFAEPLQEQYLAKAVPGNFRVKWEPEQAGCGAAVDQLPPPHLDDLTGVMPLAR